MGSAYLKRTQLLLERDGLSSFFPPLGEDEDTKIKVFEDGYIGNLFFCSPLTGCDQSTINMLRSAYSAEFPDDSIISFHHISSSYIEDYLRIYRTRREHLITGDNNLSSSQKIILNELVERKIKMMKKGKSEPLIKSSGVLNKNKFVIVSIKIPFNQNDKLEEQVLLANSLCDSFREALDQMRLHPEVVTKEEYAYLIRGILRMGEDASEPYSENMTIAEQMTDYETDVRIKKDGLLINDRAVSSLSIKALPEETTLAVMDRLIGDTMGSNAQLCDPFMLTNTIYFKSADKIKKSFSKNEKTTGYQAKGKLGTMIPDLADRHQGLSVMSDSLIKGHRPCQISLNLIVVASDKESLRRSCSRAKTFYNVHGFILQEDKNFHFPAFIHNLPGFCNKEYATMSQRFWTMTTKEAALFAPIIGEWRGTGWGANNILVSRRGQIMLCDIVDSQNNLNAVIAAGSGSGKSFWANDIFTGALSKGAQVRVIDQGRSYEKLCQILGGQFISFDLDSKICLNPFTKIKDLNEEIEGLVLLIGKMACPKAGLDDWQFPAIGRAITEVWDEHQNNMTITLLQEYLYQKGEETQDVRYTNLADQLWSYTRHGEYGQYFEGRNNLDWNNNLVILELDDLKKKKRLQQVVLMQLIMQIQQECYLGDKSIQKIFAVDEAWDLFDDPDIARFLEGAYRRFRKYKASCLVITQSLYDLYKSPAGEPIAENTNLFMLLRQNSDSIEKLRQEKKLGDNDYIYDLLTSVNTVKGKYSEIMFYGGQGVGVGRFVVDRFTQLLYSTDADEVAAISALVREGYSTKDAIMRFMEVEGTSEEEHIKLREAS